MTVHMVQQGSDEWRALRCGKVTGSRLKDVCAKIKTGWGASRATYRAELVLERLTGKPTQGYVSQAMLDGIRREPDARAEYELRMRCEVQQIGFVDHPTIAMSGASADGFVGDDGMIELKCPIAATHLAYLRSGGVPTEYMPQIAWNFACNPDRKWLDFSSYHPDFPEPMVLCTAPRVYRDDQQIAGYEAIVRDFLAELDREIDDLRARYIERKSPLLKQLQDSVNAP